MLLFVSVVLNPQYPIHCPHFVGLIVTKTPQAGDINAIFAELKADINDIKIGRGDDGNNWKKRRPYCSYEIATNVIPGCSHELGADHVRYHDYLTGKYRGPAHSDCNLQLQFHKSKNTNSYYSRYLIPVVFHNLSG